MSKEQKTYWFVRPRNAMTNEQIAAELAATGKVVEATRRGEDDPFGDYQVSWAFVKSLFQLRNREIKFSVIRRKGLYGKEEDVTRIVERFFVRKASASIAKAKADFAALRKKRE